MCEADLKGLRQSIKYIINTPQKRKKCYPVNRPPVRLQREENGSFEDWVDVPWLR